MNKINKDIIKKEIDTFFKSYNLSKIISFINLKYTLLLCYFLNFIFFILSIWFSLIIFYKNKHFTINIVFFIIFIILFIFFSLFIIFSKLKIRKNFYFYQQKYIKKLKYIYTNYVNDELKLMNSKIIDINNTWTIKPILNFVYQKNINQIDNILTLDNNKIITNIGTLSQTINFPLNNNNKLIKKDFNPYNINSYQHFFLTTKIDSKNLLFVIMFQY